MSSSVNICANEGGFLWTRILGLNRMTRNFMQATFGSSQ